jgi:hypothetical protein
MNSVPGCGLSAKDTEIKKAKTKTKKEIVLVENLWSRDIR